MTSVVSRSEAPTDVVAGERPPLDSASPAASRTNRLRAVFGAPDASVGRVDPGAFPDLAAAAKSPLSPGGEGLFAAAQLSIGAALPVGVSLGRPGEQEGSCLLPGAGHRLDASAFACPLRGQQGASPTEPSSAIAGLQQRASGLTNQFSLEVGVKDGKVRVGVQVGDLPKATVTQEGVEKGLEIFGKLSKNESLFPQKPFPSGSNEAVPGGPVKLTKEQAEGLLPESIETPKKMTFYLETASPKDGAPPPAEPTETPPAPPPPPPTKKDTTLPPPGGEVGTPGEITGLDALFLRDHLTDPISPRPGLEAFSGPPPSEAELIGRKADMAGEEDLSVQLTEAQRTELAGHDESRDPRVSYPAPIEGNER